MGITGSYVGDSLNTCLEEFEALTEATLSKFKARPRLYDYFYFFGTQISTIRIGTFSVSQKYYARNLDYLPSTASCVDFRLVRALFSRLGHTSSDLACIIKKGALVTEPTFSSAKTKILNTGIKKTKQTASQGLVFGTINPTAAHIGVYTDASSAKNDDLPSQLGILVLIRNHENNCHIIDYRSQKSRRIVSSIRGGG